MGLFNWIRKFQFSAETVTSIGSVKKGVSIIGTNINVYSLTSQAEGAPDGVGLEIVTKAIVGFEQMPITLTFQECRLLIGLLQTAVEAENVGRA